MNTRICKAVGSFLRAAFRSWFFSDNSEFASGSVWWYDGYDFADGRIFHGNCRQNQLPATGDGTGRH